MKKTSTIIRLFSLLTVLFVVAAMIFTLTSCEKDNNSADTDTNAASDSAPDTAKDTDNSADDEKITITVKVKGSDGNVTDFVITTSEEFLRGALEQEKLIEGEDGPYGLYVKVVNGETADYDVDKSYWSFYKGDEYLMTGVDTTPIANGDVFRIEYTKD